MGTQWSEFTTKDKPADTDELMALDTSGKANKRVKFSGIWDWIVEEMTTAVMSKLETQNKTLIGAVNELNSKASRGTITGTNSLEEYSVSSGKKPGVYKLEGVVIPGISNESWYGVLVLFQAYEIQIVIVGAGQVFVRVKTGKPAAWNPWRKYSCTTIQQ